MDGAGSVFGPEDGKPAPRRKRDRAMAALMRRQEGAIALGQLQAMGFSADEVVGLVEHGALQRLHRAVFLDARAPIPPRGHLFAALQAAGPAAFLSHRTAAALYGLRAINVREIELTVIAGHTPRHAGLRIHRTRNAPHTDELRTKDGLRVSSVGNDGLHWPRRDGLKWPHFASVVVGVDVA